MGRRADRSARIITLLRDAESLFLKGDGDGAAERLHAALDLDPYNPDTLRNLAILYRSTGHYLKALETYRKADAQEVTSLTTVEIANCLVNLGRHHEARGIFQRLMLTPQGRRAGASAYLMSLLYDPEASPEAIRQAHELLTSEWKIEPRPAAARRRGGPLRVGYLAADFFGDHPVAQFLSPVLECHRDSTFKIESFVYDAKPRRDGTAARIKSLATTRAINALDDEGAANLMRGDDLDLLIDLSGHTSGRRLSIFGRRPARATACFIGYPSTTGFRAVDWLIGDHVLFPERAEATYTERLARLPSWLAFAPPPSMPSPSRLRRSGPIVFGSLNHLPKLNERVIALWAKIIREVGGSLLLLKCAAFAETATADFVSLKFQEHGVAPDRILFERPEPFAAAISAYDRIDIALDPFPYNGGTTTAHALYMGVPVVTRQGAYFCGRMGASLLTAAGRSDWIASSDDCFVEIAKRLAARILDGEPLRRNLIEQARKKRLFQTADHARTLANLYENIANTDLLNSDH